MKEIRFGGAYMVLHQAGLLLWPFHKLAIVADLHLEKGSHYAQKGQFLPPQESYESLQKLLGVLEFSNVKDVILLGDSFHDEKGFKRMDDETSDLFEELCRRYKVSWVIGNHDGAFIPPRTKGVIELEIEGITLRHEAKETANGPEISGHYHPKARLDLKGQKVSRPCFIMDERRMIMPAFGAYTGGLDVNETSILKLFSPQFSCHLLGQNKIYTVPGDAVLR